MDDRVRELAMRLLSKGYDDLAPSEQRVLRQIAARTAISRNINETFRGELSFGDRVADRVAAFGGSWSFIVLFGVVILGWVVANVWLLTRPAVDQPRRSLSLRLSQPRPVDGRGASGAGHHDVAEPSGREGPDRRGA